MRHTKICVFLVIFLFIGFISQGSADTILFEAFSGEISVANPFGVFRTYNLGQPYATGTANFTVQISGGLFRFGMITSDGGHFWENPGGGDFNGPVTLDVNPGQPVSFFQVSAGGTPVLEATITYSFSGSFQSGPLASVTPEVISLAANPQAIETGKGSIMLSAVANVACVVDFSIQNSDGNIVAQGSVPTTPRSPTQQADFVWDGFVNSNPAPVGNYVGRARAQGQVTPGREVIFTIIPRVDKKLAPSGRDTGIGVAGSANNPAGRDEDPIGCDGSGGGSKSTPTKSNPPGGGSSESGEWTHARNEAIDEWREVAPFIPHFPPMPMGMPATPPAPPQPERPKHVFVWTGGTSSGLNVGDPVNIYSGNFNWSETDMSFNGRVSMVLDRNYNSLDKSVGPFGRGWLSIISTRLEFTATEAVFVNFDGAQYRFTGSNSVYLPPQGVELALTQVPDTGYWSITHNKSDEWVFDSSGKIIRWAKACCGRGLSDGVTFEYDQAGRLVKMQNPYGNRFNFAYDQNSRITAVTDSTGRSAAYEYDQAGNQVGFVDILGRRTEYRYDSEGFLTGVTQPGNRNTTIAYDNGRAVSVRSPTGEQTSFTWVDNPREVHFTDVGGVEYIYRFDNVGNLIGQTNTESGRTISLAVASNSITNFTDSQGNGYRYRYENNLMVSKIDPLGNETRYEWDLNVRKVSKETDPLGRVKQYVWCPRGNLLSITDPAGGVTRYTYDGFNNRTSVTDTLGRTTRFVYDSGGNFLKQVIDPMGGVASYTFDQRGNLIAVSDQLNRVTTSEYDAANRLTKVTYPDGRFISYEYDQVGNVSLSRDRLNRVNRFFHDANGRLTAVIKPDGSRIEKQYDSAGRLIVESDTVGRINRFEYDGSGRQTKMLFGDGANVSYGYDRENRLTSMTNELGDTMTMEYDALGRPTGMRDQAGNRWEAGFDAASRKTTTKDPFNRVTRYQFDNLDRIVKVIRADSSFITNSFDAVGNLLGLVDALGKTWSWNYDNLNRQIKAVQPNGASSTTTFDAVGQVTAETDALGRITRYAFDNGGRRVSTTDALDNVWRNFFDNVGRLTAVQDPLGAVSSMTYDVMDRVISESDPLGNVNRYEFDAAGRRVAKADALNRRSITVYDVRDRVTSEVDPEGRTVLYAYNLAGQRLRLNDGANRIWRWEYDSLGRITSEIDPLGNANRYRFDSVGNRIAWTNARNQTTNYLFDQMNRLSRISYPDGTAATMSYDLNGRELVRSSKHGLTSKTYDFVGNLTREVFSVQQAGINATKIWQYSFDSAGNRIRAIDPEGGVYNYVFDKLNRLVRLDPPPRNDDVRYSFDPAGRLVTEERPGVKTVNVFDKAGRLLELRHERDRGREKFVASRKYQYNAVGNRFSMIDEEGKKTSYSFNNADWLTKASYPDGQQVSYRYNGAGDRIEEKIETPTVKKVGRHKVIGTDTVVIPMVYDAGGRLVSKGADTFTFDADGNQVKAVESGDETRYSWTPDNRLAKVERDIECPKHRRKRCRLCPQPLVFSEAYTYLPNDWKRITRTTKDSIGPEKTFISVYDGDDESHEYQLKTGRARDDDKDDRDRKDKKCPDKDDKKPRLKLIRQFIGGPGTDDLVSTKYHGRNLWHLKDALGSTIALTNRGGHAVARIGYDAWGSFRWPHKPGHEKPPCREDELHNWLDKFDFGRTFGFDLDGWHWGRHHAKTITPFLFTGRRFDNFSNLYNNRNRYYSPKIGRFTSRDPIGFEGGQNLWGYAANNPARWKDPFGKVIEIIIDNGMLWGLGGWLTGTANLTIRAVNANVDANPFEVTYTLPRDLANALSDNADLRGRLNGLDLAYVQNPTSPNFCRLIDLSDRNALWHDIVGNVNGFLQGVYEIYRQPDSQGGLPVINGPNNLPQDLLPPDE